MKIVVLFGGRSGEHEVSLVSATSVIAALDRGKYEVTEVGITEEGEWLCGADCLAKFKKKDFSGLGAVDFANFKPDVVFPVLHGPFGEDGTLQGMLEMLRIPYVGCGVLAAAVGMDKVTSKIVWQAAGIGVVPWQNFTRREFERDREGILRGVEKEFGFPVFVKPINMGSSVGVSKVKSFEELLPAIELALRFDRKVMVEKGLNVREIECAVLEGLDGDLLVSEPGEVIVGGEFYDFNDKYVNGVSTTEIPAKISASERAEIMELAGRAFKALDGSGLSRVDFFLDRDDGRIYINEINAMPGFTSISMYPKMMAASGIGYGELVDRLIALAVARGKERNSLDLKFESGSGWFKED
ncbi:D-alanine--D-alanine ligase [Candidatus Gracilibacteria bacterium]|nr:D-alanine--D-alanine ligase [Candidatus Gracilibacteria bacterium]